MEQVRPRLEAFAAEMLGGLARGRVTAQIPCGTYYWPVASHDPIATDWTTTGPPAAMRDEACTAKNPASWSVLAWLATLGGAVLLAVGAVRAAIGASRGDGAARA
jgi:hypothetical protein